MSSPVVAVVPVDVLVVEEWAVDVVEDDDKE
jgi:hypothetical protein